MKSRISFLWRSPHLWEPYVLRRIVWEFLGLVLFYFVVNLFVSWRQSLELPEASLLLEEGYKKGEISYSLYLLSQFPYGSLSSLGLISLYLGWCIANKKICLWILAEKKTNVKTLISIELYSFSVILFYLILFMLVSNWKYNLNDLEFLFVVSLGMGLCMGLIFWSAYRYVQCSFRWWGQPKGRAFLVWIVPHLTIVLLIWGARA
jgi:hypothetical protein